MSEKETFVFQSEGKELLDLMVHSVYSNRDIFLRELVSNASDALDKLRLEGLTDADLAGDLAGGEIRLMVDEGRRALTVADTGVGMNREDLVNYLGTIARSGTREFVRLARERATAAAPELIGQFGVGFYACFMVAERVEVVSRKIREPQAWKWSSTGDGTYTIEEAKRDRPGTSVTLFLKPAEEEGGMEDYADPLVLEGIVKRYSDFVPWPIRLRGEKEDETLNSMQAIWTRPEGEVSDEEFEEFYHHVSHDWGKPAYRITTRAEGTTSYRALLFIPERAPLDLFLREAKRGIALYIRRVFIMHDCTELIPEYLRFLRGVVDSEDLPLNISREILQKDRASLAIRSGLVRKVLDTLRTALAKEREQYRSFWKEFGAVLKEGIFADEKNRQTLLGISLFASSTEKDPVTLEEYVGRMKPDQHAIWYLTGTSVEGMKASPHLELLAARGYEVLLLDDPVDELWTQGVTEFQGKPLRSVAKGEAEVGGGEEREKARELRKAAEGEFGPLCQALQGFLDHEVKEVRVSGRLTASPACLVGETHDMTPQLEKLLRHMGRDLPPVKRVLEINPEHPVLQGLRNLHAADAADPRLPEFAQVLLGQAQLAEGAELADPTGFSRRVAKLLETVLAEPRS